MDLDQSVSLQHFNTGQTHYLTQHVVIRKDKGTI